MNLNSLHKIEKPYKRPRCMCGIYFKHCVTNVNHAIPSAISGFITELITSAVYCYFLLLCIKIEKPYKCPRCLFGICLKYCLTNINHAVPYAMSGFRTELITSAVYCYFLRCLYKDREAIQTPELILQKTC